MQSGQNSLAESCFGSPWHCTSRVHQNSLPQPLGMLQWMGHTHAPIDVTYKHQKQNYWVSDNKIKPNMGSCGAIKLAAWFPAREAGWAQLASAVLVMPVLWSRSGFAHKYVSMTFTCIGAQLFRTMGAIEGSGLLMRKYFSRFMATLKIEESWTICTPVIDYEWFMHSIQPTFLCRF
jgi:hypothetical protein